MSPWRSLGLPLGMALLTLCHPAQAQSLRGSVGAELRAYPDEPLFPDQDEDQVQVSAFANLNASVDIGEARFDLELFGRAAPDFSREFSGDVRQAYVRFETGKAEWKIGVLNETWGVLEAWNPTDIINQRDLVEDFQGDVKLGQPGVLMSLQLDGATLSIFGTGYARERRLSRGEDRFRFFPVPFAEERFEHGRWEPSGAVRLEVPMGDFSIAASQFLGTAREPTFQPVIGPGRLEAFRAYYGQISQTALEAQYVWGDFILKGEFIHQRGDADKSWGGGIGLERTFSKFAGGMGDLSLYAEGYADSRDADAPFTPFQRDVFVGARFGFNDPGDTLLDLRLTHDLEYGSSLAEVRANRRVLDGFVLSFNFLTTLNDKRDPALSGFARDTQFKLRLARYF